MNPYWMSSDNKDYARLDPAKYYPALYRQVRELMPELTELQIKKVCALVTETCSYCHADAARNCNCMRDD